MNVSAKDTTETEVVFNKQETALHETIRFAAHFSTSYHIPVQWKGDSIGLNKHWEPYFTAGIHLDFPSYIPKMLVRLAAEAGKVEKSSQPLKKVEIIHASLSLSYDFRVIIDNLSIRPRIGLSNALINAGDFHVSDFTTHIFRDVENEFGILAGFEPVLKIKRLQIAIPVNIDFIFSSPNTFITGSVSLTAGAVF